MYKNIIWKCNNLFYNLWYLSNKFFVKNIFLNLWLQMTTEICRLIQKITEWFLKESIQNFSCFKTLYISFWDKTMAHSDYKSKHKQQKHFTKQKPTRILCSFSRFALVGKEMLHSGLKWLRLRHLWR